MNDSMRRVGAAACAVLALTAILAGRGSTLTAGTATAAPPAFPYSHMSVQTAEKANSPAGTLYVTVDDGSALPSSARSRAVPGDGTPSRDAAYTDPQACERVHGHQGVCWRYWQVIGTEIRVWTTYQERSCVVIGSTTGDQTRTLCDGVPVRS